MLRCLPLAVAVLVLAACDDDRPKKPGPSGPCPAATRGCSCDGSRCAVGLTCDAGYCAPTDCTRGARDCVCHADGICDPLGTVPMTCNGNICEPTRELIAGSLGGACGSGCGDHEGASLECRDGICELPGCPSGQVGCPCGPFGGCEPYEGNQIRCSLGVCTLGACAPGTSACICDDDACDSGLGCSNGVCRPLARRAALAIGDSSARACDVLLHEQDNAARDVTFAAQVRGESQRRAPKLALSFISRSDAGFAGTVAVVEGESSSSAANAGFVVSSAECFDRLGNSLGGSSVTLE